ncbi:hypothetical protein HF638_18910 [Paenibacillus sp. SZ31]|uniref:hypothetical protein n=1 Tax=unclassified Paenibacillus TaxID=185978 RepID=UPI00146D4AF9|nr:hypothetical protein [Paenibacillus sp. SZ31]NMI06054.1 hypothetical protein [Paenibacillus sp. SZ31]
MQLSDMQKILMTCLLFILILWFLIQGIRKHTGNGRGSSFRRWGGWLIGLFIVGAVPLGFALYTKIFDERLDANIGLGLAMFFVWAYCVILLCTALVVWGRYLYKRNIKK